MDFSHVKSIMSIFVILLLKNQSSMEFIQMISNRKQQNIRWRQSWIWFFTALVFQFQYFFFNATWHFMFEIWDESNFWRLNNSFIKTYVKSEVLPLIIWWYIRKIVCWSNVLSNDTWSYIIVVVESESLKLCVVWVDILMIWSACYLATATNSWCIRWACWNCWITGTCWTCRLIVYWRWRCFWSVFVVLLSIIFVS